MRRLIVTASDLHDGQYTKSSRILSKCWPLGELKLSPAQNVFGRICGYRDYHDVHQNAVQTVGASASLLSSSAAQIVAWNMYRNFNIPFAEARVVAGKLHLGKFAVCQASPLEQAMSARAGKPLVMDEFHLLTPGDKWSSWTPALIAAGVSPFSYSVDRSGAVVQWRLMTEQLDELPGDLAERLRSEERYSVLGDDTQVLNEFINNEIVPLATKPIQAAIREDGLLPHGFKVIPLFNEQGDYRGHGILNVILGGLLPVICKLEQIPEFIALHLAGRAIPMSRFDARIKPGSGAGITAARKIDGGMTVFNVSNVSAGEGWAVFEYSGAELLYTFRSPRAAEDFTHRVKLGVLAPAPASDIAPLGSIILDDTRFPTHPAQLGGPAQLIVDGEMIDRTPQTDKLLGPVFTFNRVTYLRAQTWLSIADVPMTVLPLMSELLPKRGDFDSTNSEVLPGAALEFHYQLEWCLSHVTTQAQRTLATIESATHLLQLGNAHLNPTDLKRKVWAEIDEDLPVLSEDGTETSNNELLDDRHESLQRMRENGGLLKVVMPALDAYDETVLGYLLLRSAGEYPGSRYESFVTVPSSVQYKKQSQYLSFVTVYCLGLSRLSSRLEDLPVDPLVVILDQVLNGQLPLSELEAAVAGFADLIRKFSAQAKSIEGIKRWQAAETSRSIAAHGLGLLSVGEAISATKPAGIEDIYRMGRKTNSGSVQVVQSQKGIGRKQKGEHR